MPTPTSPSRGPAFRVYAPRAEAVSATGDFGTVPLARSADGTWSGSAAAAKAGQRYHFVLHVNGADLTRPDPNGRMLDGAESVLVDPAAYRWRDSAFRRPPLDQAVIYELHVGSFAPGASGAWGTYRDVIAKLDYLKSLGVGYVELLPVQDSERPFDWGYGVNLPNTLEPTYGSPDELRRLVDEAHARGLGVLFDVVYNHFSRASALVGFDGGNSYFYEGPHGLTEWGPRPDFGNPAVRGLIESGIDRYVNEYHADGFRWDAAPYIARFHDFDPALNRKTDDGPNPDGESLLREINGGQSPLVKIAEWFGAPPEVTTPASRGGIGFDAHWNGLFSVTKAITDPAQADVAKIAALVEGPADRVLFTESHDEVGHPPAQRRVPALIDPADPSSFAARKRSLLGAAVALTAPGVPMLFQGQELLESADFAFPTGTPLDWSKAATFAGITRAYRDLIALHAELAGPAQAYHRNAGAKVLAYRRGNTVVIANFGGRSYAAYELGVPEARAWRVRFTSDDRVYSADFGGEPVMRTLRATPEPRDGLPASLSVELPAFTAIVLE